MTEFKTPTQNGWKYRECVKWYRKKIYENEFTTKKYRTKHTVYYYSSDGALEPVISNYNEQYQVLEVFKQIGGKEIFVYYSLPSYRSHQILNAYEEVRPSKSIYQFIDRIDKQTTEDFNIANLIKDEFETNNQLNDVGSKEQQKNSLEYRVYKQYKEQGF